MTRPPFTYDEPVRNRTTGETGRIVGTCDSFGLIPVIHDQPPLGVCRVSEHRLERIVERDLLFTVEMQRRAG